MTGFITSQPVRQDVSANTWRLVKIAFELNFLKSYKIGEMAGKLVSTCQSYRCNST